MSRNGKILIVLLGVLFIAIIYRILNPYRQPTVAKLKYTGKADRDKTPSHAIRLDEKRLTADQTVLIDLLVNPPRHSDKTVKDMFVLSKTPAVQAEEIVADPKTSGTAESPLVEKPDPYAQINEAIRQFTIFGIYERNKEKVVFLEKGKDVLMVREGDRIDGKYLIERITDQEVVFKVEELNAPITINIQGL